MPGFVAVAGQIGIDDFRMPRAEHDHDVPGGIQDDRGIEVAVLAPDYRSASKIGSRDRDGHLGARVQMNRSATGVVADGGAG